MCCIETPDVVVTPRLRLRELRGKDAARISQLANDPGVTRMTSRMPSPYSLDDARSFLAAKAERDRVNDQTFAIEHPDAGLIGVIGLSPAMYSGSELGYWLGRPYWRQGFATEAARAVVGWARDVWGRRLVVAGHFADNPSSGQVLCKADFLYTGEVQHRHSTARGEPAATRMMVWLA